MLLNGEMFEDRRPMLKVVKNTMYVQDLGMKGTMGRERVQSGEKTYNYRKFELRTMESYNNHYNGHIF